MMCLVLCVMMGVAKVGREVDDVLGVVCGDGGG